MLRYRMPSRRSVRTSFAVVLMLLSTALPLWADEPVVPDAVDSLLRIARDLSELSVAARRTPEAVLATKPVHEMKHTEMQQLGLTTLADALKLFVGTEVRDYGGIGGMKTVSVRSLGAHHTAVSYDGLTLSNTQAGQIDIGRYQLDGVSAVSMSVGANDDLLQSARHSASGGVLNIISEQPCFFEGRSSMFRARLRGGSFGLVAPSLRYAQRLGANTAFTLDGLMLRADGQYPFILRNADTHTSEKRHNSDVFSWQSEINVYHTLRDSSLLKLKGSYYDSHRGLPGAVILYNPFSDDRLSERDGFAQAVFEKSFNASFALRSGLKYTHTRSHFEGSNAAYTGGRQVDHSRQDEAYATTSVRWSPFPSLAFALAQDVSVNLLHSNIYINTNFDVPNPCRTTSLTALSGRFHTGRISADATLLGTYAVEHVEAGTAPPVRRHLSPTVAFSYRLLPTHSFFLRLMYKHTYRLPSFNDTYYRRMGNPNLRPERANEFNLGLTLNLPSTSWQQFLSVTLDGYYNRVTDKIVAFPAAYVWRMANFGLVNIYGLDATLATEIPLCRLLSIGLTASYTYQQALDADSRSATYNRQLPYTPRNHGAVSAIAHTPWVNLGYSVHYSSARYSSPQNRNSERLAPYAEHALTLTRSLAFNLCQLDLGLSVHNLTAARYEIIQYYPMPGRSLYATAAITF